MVLNRFQRFQKRAFDLFLSSVGLILSLPIIVVAWIIASIETKANGFFIQERVGKDGKIIKVIKIRTMRRGSSTSTP